MLCFYVYELISILPVSSLFCWIQSVNNYDPVLDKKCFKEFILYFQKRTNWEIIKLADSVEVFENNIVTEESYKYFCLK